MVIKGVYDETWVIGESDPLEIEQEIEISLYEQMEYTQVWIRPGEWDAKNSKGFWDTNGSPFQTSTRG